MTERGAFTRRQLVRGLVAGLGTAAVATSAPWASTAAFGRRAATRTAGAAPAQPAGIGAYSADVLPPGIRSRFAHDINGITMHVLEGGYEATNRPGVLLLHGEVRLKGRTYIRSPGAYQVRMQRSVDDEPFTNFGTVWWKRVEP